MGAVVAGIEQVDGDPGAVEDAAAGLRGLGGGLAHTAATVVAAAGATPDWSGRAAIAFDARCGDYRSAASMAEDACTRVAHALAGYAHHLAEGRRRIARLQDRGQELERQAADADRRSAQAAQSAASYAQLARQAAFDAPADGGAMRDHFNASAVQAREDQAAAARAADRARQELDTLRALADRERQDVREAGHHAAVAVHAAAGDLPRVSWPAYGTPAAVTTSSQGVRDASEIGAYFVRLGDDKSALIERKSDGTVSVTTAKGLEVGLAGSLGSKAQVGPGGGAGPRVLVSRDLTAAALARLENGRTYDFPNDAAAAQFTDRLTGKEGGGGGFVPPLAVITGPVVEFLAGGASPDDGRKPSKTYFQVGANFAASGSSSMSDVGGVTGEVHRQEAIGAQRDERTGEETYYAKTATDGSIGATVLMAGANRSRGGESVTAITYDAGRPKTLSITSTRSAAGAFTATGDLKGVKDLRSLTKHLESAEFSAGGQTGRTVEVQAQLDLHHADAAAAARRYLASNGADSAAVHDLVERMNRDGQLDVRVYSTHESTGGLDVEAHGFGAKLEHVESSATLESAMTRTPGDLQFLPVRVR